jgi:hypothetical protein
MKKFMLVACLLSFDALVDAAEAKGGAGAGKPSIGASIARAFGFGGGARAVSTAVASSSASEDKAVAAPSVAAPSVALAPVPAHPSVLSDADAATLLAVLTLPKLVIRGRTETDIRQTHVLAVNTADAEKPVEPFVSIFDYVRLKQGAFTRAGITVSKDTDAEAMREIILRVNARMIATGGANAHVKVGPELLVGSVLCGSLK